MNESFSELLRIAQQGDRSAAGRILDDCRPYLLAIANRELSPRVAAKIGASDVVQETMIAAQEAIERFEGTDKEDLLAWLRIILINDLRKTHRHFTTDKRHVEREWPIDVGSQAAPAHQLPSPLETPSATASGHEEEARVREAMNQLSELERQIIQMRNWQRLSFAEIGIEIGRSSEASRKLWSRAIERLQKIMDDQR